MKKYLSKKYSEQTGFTLSEVLIVLGIIGIIASMTMPTLITNYQKMQVAVQLKKGYSELFQAIKVSESNYGTIETWDFTNYASPAERAEDFAKNYLLPNIKTLKTCFPSSNECWSGEVYSIDNKKQSYLSNTYSGHYSFVSSSGYSVYYWLHATGTGGWFFIDINGLKKPNRIGRDVFPFTIQWISKDAEHVEGDSVCSAPISRMRLGLFPVGGGCIPSNSREELKENTYGGCKKGSNFRDAGYLCGALIMFDGWEIKKDYPW